MPPAFRGCCAWCLGWTSPKSNANTWAVSARGFNDQFSNKLLVLIDGRAIYTPLLGGVNWDTADVPLEDIDRIEVIRGPGAAVWGANAVNGVINIVTKSAADTHGALFVADGGTGGQAQDTLQYGGAIKENTNYRVFANYLNYGSLPAVGGGSGQDNWNLLHGGFRSDSKISTSDSLTFQGDLYTGQAGATIIHIFSVAPPVTGNLNVDAQLSGGNILGGGTISFRAVPRPLFSFTSTIMSRPAPNPPKPGARLILISIITGLGDLARM